MSDRRAPGGTDSAHPVAELGVADVPRPDYRGLLHRVPAILYTADTGECGRWLYVSPQIEPILGFSPQEWCADPGLWARRLHPDDVERVLEQEAGMAEGTFGASATEYRLLHRDGHPVWLRDDALLEEDEDRVCRWHGVMSDITHQKAVPELGERPRRLG